MASVTRRTGTRGKAQRSSVEENLERALARLVGKGSSFTQLSVEALAAEAGIARATFYLHFRDKGELVAKLMQRVTEEITAAARLESPETATREDLRATVAAVVALYRRHYALMAAIVETAAYDPEVERLFQAMMRTLVEVNRKALVRRRQAGLVAHDVPALTPDVVTWAFERACHQLVRSRKAAQAEALVDALTHILWAAIYEAGE
jgi:AcrR family transcriptional regulator